MVFLFKNTNGPITWGAVSNIMPTPITGLTATSTVAGQITLTWSGGIGQNAKYSYALSSGTVQSIGTLTGNGVGTPYSVTLTLTSTAQITTTVTLTATLLGGSASSVSNSITTVSPAVYVNGTVMPLPSTGTTGVNTTALTSASTVISGITVTLSFMNGTYNASSSSNGAGTVPYTMFSSSTSNFWICNYGGNSYGQNAYSNYVYQGGINPTVYVTTTVSGSTVAGEWLQLQFPYSFVLTGHGWLQRPGYSYEWIGLNYTVAGSNDGTTWTQISKKIYTLGTLPPASNGSYIETITSSTAYSYYRLICTSAMNDAGANWYGSKWYLYGTK